MTETQAAAPVRIAAGADVDARAEIGEGTSVWHLAQIR
jgi:UDP-2-acetamido-3-amino-2,3-dideoxy-glucuronate N-acetyltransferase